MDNRWWKEARRALPLALLTALLVAGPAEAHAYIERSTPTDGAAVFDSPSEIRVVFTEPVDPALSRLVLTDARGRAVEGTRQETAGNLDLELVLRIPHLPDGPYLLESKALGKDGHVTEETVQFYVGTPPPDWKSALAPDAAPGAAGGNAGVILAAVLFLGVLGGGVWLSLQALRKPR